MYIFKLCPRPTGSDTLGMGHFSILVRPPGNLMHAKIEDDGAREAVHKC